MTTVGTSISVLVVENDLDFALVLGGHLSAEPGLEAVDFCTTARQAIQRIEEMSPDVALVDLELDERSWGLDVIRRVRERELSTRCLVLTNFEDDEYVFQAFRLGAIGYLLKQADYEEDAADIGKTIRLSMEGGAYMSPRIAEKIRRELFSEEELAVARLGLAPRHVEVIELLCHGYRPDVIAGKTGRTLSTVYTYQAEIYRILAVNSSVEAVYKYLSAKFRAQGKEGVSSEGAANGRDGQSG